MRSQPGVRWYGTFSNGSSRSSALLVVPDEDVDPHELVLDVRAAERTLLDRPERNNPLLPRGPPRPCDPGRQAPGRARRRASRPGPPPTCATMAFLASSAYSRAFAWSPRSAHACARTIPQVPRSSSNAPGVRRSNTSRCASSSTQSRSSPVAKSTTRAVGSTSFGAAANTARAPARSPSWRKVIAFRLIRLRFAGARTRPRSIASRASPVRRSERRVAPSSRSPSHERGSSSRARRRCASASSHRPWARSTRPDPRRRSASSGARLSPRAYASRAFSWSLPDAAVVVPEGTVPLGHAGCQLDGPLRRLPRRLPHPAARAHLRGRSRSG